MSKRPGFKRERPLYRLKFADDEFDGLEVMAKSLPLGQFFELQRLQEKASSDPGAAEQIIHKLADVLTAWNLEGDDDKPVPCNYGGLASLDMPFVLTIFAAWMDAVAGVPNRSSNDSNGGETSPEPSIPMDPP